MPDAGRPDPWVFLTLLSALLFAAGNAIQKHGVQGRLPPLAATAFVAGLPRVLAALLCSPAWLLGLALSALAFSVEVQAIALGDVSAVKPLSRVQAVFTVAIGVCILRERLRRAEWLGVVVIATAAAVLARERGGSLVHAPGLPIVVAAGFGVVALAAGLLFAPDRGGRRAHSELAPALAAGVLFGFGDVLMKMSAESVTARTGAFDLASGATLGGLAGSAELRFSLAATTAAFLIQQLAFARGRVSLAMPLIGVGGTAVTVTLGALLLREPLGAARLAAVAAMLAGGWLAAGAGGLRPAPVHPKEVTR